jgi:hypothetical protein
MTPESDILEQVLRGALSLPPLSLKAVEQTSLARDRSRPDLVIEAQWGAERVRFIAQVKRLATPKAVDEAITQARSLASPPQTYPMIIVPYLSEARLVELQEAQVSALDLCGNGVTVVPGKITVFRTGHPNRFPQSAKLRNVYRGKSSIVARAFLIQPQFDKVKEIMDLLAKRQGSVVFSTVSKVLKRLEDDLVITRDKRLIKLIQADTLLDNLASNYDPPLIMERFRGRCALRREEIIRRLTTSAAAKAGKLVLTGAASTEKYAAMAGEPVASLYCTTMPTSLLSAADVDAEETDFFSNLQILRTNDDRVFFDPRLEGGIPYASPIQTWLELAAGDKRQKDAAKQLGRTIRASLRMPGEDDRG